MCVCVCAYIHTYIHTYIQRSGSDQLRVMLLLYMICMYVCVCMYVCGLGQIICMYVCMCMYVCVCMYVCGLGEISLELCYSRAHALRSTPQHQALRGGED